LRKYLCMKLLCFLMGGIDVFCNKPFLLSDGSHLFHNNPIPFIILSLHFILTWMLDYSHLGNKMFPRWEENIPSLGISALPYSQGAFAYHCQHCVRCLYCKKGGTTIEPHLSISDSKSNYFIYFQGLSKLTGPFSSFWHTISISSKCCCPSSHFST